MHTSLFGRLLLALSAIAIVASLAACSSISAPKPLTPHEMQQLDTIMG
jgi:hypothetical protein